MRAISHISPRQQEAKLARLAKELRTELGNRNPQGLARLLNSPDMLLRKELLGLYATLGQCVDRIPQVSPRSLGHTPETEARA